MARTGEDYAFVHAAAYLLLSPATGLSDTGESSMLAHVLWYGMSDHPTQRGVSDRVELIVHLSVATAISGSTDSNGTRWFNTSTAD